MNHLPAEVINLMVKLVPRSYAVISRLSRWHYGCVIGDIEQIKTLSLRRIELFNKSYWILPNGEIHGKYIVYHEAGKVYIDADYVEGKQHGKYITYDKAGNKVSEVDYVNDRVHGRYIGYYDTGEIFYEVMYENDKSQGLYHYYSRNGNYIVKLKP